MLLETFCFPFMTGQAFGCEKKPKNVTAVSDYDNDNYAFMGLITSLCCTGTAVKPNIVPLLA